MRSKSHVVNRPRVGGPAFTLAENMVAMAITGIVVTALYAGINSGFYSVRLARENLRATEILLDKMEAVRVCTWDQINSNGFIPPAFTALYCPATPSSSPGGGTPSVETNGLVYNGAIVVKPVTPARLNADYHKDLRQVTINLNWNSGSQDHNRQVTTYVSRYGLQNCLFQ